MSKGKVDRAAILDEYEGLQAERGNFAAVAEIPLITALLDARIAELREVLAGKRRYRAIETAAAKATKP